MGPVNEISPAGRKKRSWGATIGQSCNLEGDFVGRQKIVRVKPLDVMSFTQCKCFIARGGSPLIGLLMNDNTAGTETIGNRKGPIFGAIIYDDDFLVRPGLRQSGLEGSGE